MKLSPLEIIEIFFHVIVAFFLVTAYQEYGESFKYFAAPYVLYLVLKENPNYFPAIFINVAGGSTIAIAVLIGCLILTIKHLRYFSDIFGTWFLVFVFLPGPVLLYQSFYRYYFMETDIVNSIIPLGFYLGIFPFFYGILISRKFPVDLFKVLYLTFIFIIIYNILTITAPLRIVTFVLELYTVVGILILLPVKIKIGVNIFYKITALLTLVGIATGFLEVKFHFLGSILLAVFMIVIYWWRNDLLLNLLTNKRLIVLLVLVMAYIMSQTYNYSLSNVPLSSFSYTDITSYPAFIMYKAFADRGVIWNAVWSDILYYQYIMPPYFVSGYSFTSISGSRIEVEYGAHNLFLELMRQYGILFGIIVSIVYIAIIVYLGKVFKTKLDDFYVLFLSASVFGMGVVTGLTGMYTLMINFSFLFIGLAGILYGHAIVNNYSVEPEKVRFSTGRK